MGKTSNKVHDAWQNKNYDRVVLKIKKGEKEKLKQIADSLTPKISVSRLIVNAINSQFPGLLSPLDDTSKQPKNKKNG